MYNTPQPRQRVYLVDSLRGLSILLMIIYHLGYSMVMQDVLPAIVIKNPLISSLQVIFASLFILLCGFSCEYSRSNLKRGIRILLCACVVTAVTVFFSTSTIIYGILHFLGTAVLIYCFSRKMWDKIPVKAQPFIYLALFAVLYIITETLSAPPYNAQLPPHLWIIGLADASFRSADYFPVIPWFFMFMAGTWLGKMSLNGKMPGWFYSVRCTPLEFAGRHTLLIYLIHQPIIQTILYFI